MQKLLFALIFLSSKTFGAWEELKCKLEDEIHPNGVQYIDVQKVNTPGYSLTIGGPINCDVSITTKDPSIENSELDSRKYTFSEDGGFYIYSIAKSQISDAWIKSHWKYNQLVQKKGYSPARAIDYMRTSTFHTIGSKVYKFAPKKQSQKVFRNPRTHELKIITQNGMTIYIDPKTGLINEEKTTDINVKQKPLLHYQDVISMSNPKETMISFPFSMGGYNFAKRDVKVDLEKGTTRCKVQQKEVFDYELGCRTVREWPCQCKKEDTYKIGRCTLASSKLNHIHQDDLDGTKIKDTSSLHTALKKTGNCQNLFLAESQNKPSKKLKIISPTIKKPVAYSSRRPTSKQLSQSQLKKPELSVGPKKPVTSKDTLGCQEKLRDYFRDHKNKELIQRYIKLQGKITLHRIAWTYMKMTKNNTKEIEQNLDDLLAKRNPHLHADFIISKQKTHNQKLLMAMQILKAESKSFIRSPEEKNYSLHYSDVKMIELLVAAENFHGRSAKSGIMNFTSIINNSLKTRLKKKTENLLYAQKIINALIAQTKSIEKKITEYLKSTGCHKQVPSLAHCHNLNQLFNLSQTLSESENIIDYIYHDKLGQEDELKETFKWGTYWLHVVK